MNYISIFISGVLIGIPLCFTLGPVFFALLQNSISNGFKSAFFIATGVILADVILFLAAYSGTNLFMHDGTSNATSVKFWVEISGGIVLVLMGFFTIRKHVVESDEKKFFQNPVMYLARGFALNFLNPATFFAWVVVTSNFNHVYTDISLRATFYTAALASVYVTELIIAYFAARIRKILNDRVMRIISMVNGLIFIGCGILLFAIAFGITASK